MPPTEADKSTRQNVDIDGGLDGMIRNVMFPNKFSVAAIIDEHSSSAAVPLEEVLHYRRVFMSHPVQVSEYTIHKVKNRGERGQGKRRSSDRRAKAATTFYEAASERP